MNFSRSCSLSHQLRCPDLCKEAERPRQLKHMDKDISPVKRISEKDTFFSMAHSLCHGEHKDFYQDTAEGDDLHLPQCLLCRCSPTSHFLMKWGHQKPLHASFLKRTSPTPRTHAALQYQWELNSIGLNSGYKYSLSF